MSSESSSPQSQDSAEEDEGEEGYRPGGYHRVSLGDAVGDWRIQHKLGWGHFSTVWLASKPAAPLCALKIQKSAAHYMQAAKDEIALLQAMNAHAGEPGRAHVVKLLDSFTHDGPHGKHAVMAFEVLGDNLLSLIKHWDYHGVPYAMCRQICMQTCAGLDFLHRVCGIIHTDLKPENILVAGMRASRAVRCQVSLPALAALRTARGTTAVRAQDVWEARIAALRQAMESMDVAHKRKADKKLRGMLDKLEAVMGEPAIAAAAGLPGDAVVAGAARAAHDYDNDNGWQVVAGRSKASAATAAAAAEPERFRALSDVAECAELCRRNFDWLPSLRMGDDAANGHPASEAGGDGGGEWEPVGVLLVPEAALHALASQGDVLSVPGGSALRKAGRTEHADALVDALEMGRRAELGKPSKHSKRQSAGRGPRTNDETGWAAHHILLRRGCERPQQALGALETALGVVLLFHARALATSPHSRCVGLPASALPFSAPLRSLAERMEEAACPPPLADTFVGVDPLSVGLDGAGTDVVIKIVDMGNACWADKHFSDDIQTRQYRSPEVILQSGYDAACDMWSFACIAFELVTGDLLFDPQSGDDYTRDEDHLALMIELIGRVPINCSVLSGSQRDRFFDGKNDLRHIRRLKFWPVNRVLVEKYKMDEGRARALQDFLLPLLQWEPNARQTAEVCLKSEWLNMQQ